MAKMLPPYISEDIQSTGEKLIFSLFQNDPKTSDWIVLHSLNLNQHVTRMYGEIDFVVLAPKLGIFCLEVKSGRVERKNGIWKFTNRFGKSVEKNRSPFSQAREGMFSIKEVIRRKFGLGSRLDKLLFSYGVMFPHIEFIANGIEEEQYQIYDRNSRSFPISNYIEKISSSTRKKAEQNHRFNTNESMPTIKEINELANFLRGDFEKIVTVNTLVTDRESELNAFTQEQYSCLDQLNENNRCLIQGAAGTGKTMIAMESARRSIAENKRVLFLCYNSILSDWLKTELVYDKDQLIIDNFHGLLFNLCKENNFQIKNSDQDFFFKNDLPLMALEAIDKGSIRPFDTLIIDEGQDLITAEYLDVLDALLIGGIAGGKWQIFCDFEYQAIYTKASKREMLDKLESRSSFTNFKLNINCRNTRQIGEEVSLICGIEKLSYLVNKMEGFSVGYHFYNNSDEEQSILENLLIKFQEDKIPPNKITILSPHKLEFSIVNKLDRNAYKIEDYKSKQINSKNLSTNFATIQSFKGMENSFIILVDIDLTKSEEILKLLYVGMSRARFGLQVIMNKTSQSTYRDIINKAITSGS